MRATHSPGYASDWENDPIWGLDVLGDTVQGGGHAHA